MQELDKNEIHKGLSHTSVELSYKFWGLKRKQITVTPEDGGLSPLEILVIMRQSAEIYTARVERIVRNEDMDNLPKLHDFDEKKLMRRIDLEEETPKANINIFMAARSDMLNLISFDDDVWEKKKCLHETKGVMTLQELLADLVIRERAYLDKLNELLPE